MTLLLTGGTGFIGQQLSFRLRPPGDGQLIRLLRSTQRTDFVESTDIIGDLTNAADVERFVTAGHILVHLACMGNPRSSNRDILGDIEQNLVPTVRLFESFAKRQPAGHVVFASTGGDMYSFDPPYLPRREVDTPHPNSSYGIHKLAAERYLAQFCRTFGIAGTILRISNPYGVPLSPKRGHGLIGVALSMLRARRQIAVIEPITSVRDYLHLDDLSEAFQTVIDNPPSAGACRVLNVGYGEGYSIANVFDVVEEVTSIKIDWRDEIPPGSSPSWNVLDSGKIRAAVGWQARIDLKTGIERLWISINAPPDNRVI